MLLEDGRHRLGRWPSARQIIYEARSASALADDTTLKRTWSGKRYFVCIFEVLAYPFRCSFELEEELWIKSRSIWWQQRLEPPILNQIRHIAVKSHVSVILGYHKRQNGFQHIGDLYASCSTRRMSLFFFDGLHSMDHCEGMKFFREM